MTLLLALLLVTLVCAPFAVALPLAGALVFVSLRVGVVRPDAQPISLRAAVPSRAPPR